RTVRGGGGSGVGGGSRRVLGQGGREFTHLKRGRRRANRRYYQHHEVLLIRRIRELLYEEGFTISGARNRLDNGNAHEERAEPAPRGGRPEGAAGGVDIGAIKRELRAVLDQLQG